MEHTSIPTERSINSPRTQPKLVGFGNLLHGPCILLTEYPSDILKCYNVQPLALSSNHPITYLDGNQCNTNSLLDMSSQAPNHKITLICSLSLYPIKELVSNSSNVFLSVVKIIHSHRDFMTGRHPTTISLFLILICIEVLIQNDKLLTPISLSQTYSPNLSIAFIYVDGS